MSERALPPFRHLRPAVTAAAAYVVAALVWAGFGAVLPGGRWFAVHLFTVGVLSNLVVALTHHFAQTLLHSGGPASRPGRLALLNLGAGAMLAGRLLSWTALFGTGAAGLIAAVSWLYLDLRQQRRRSLTKRFAFVVRGYERACGAFFHGALLGLLMGTGLLGGSWHGAARLAHLHLGVLGWGGLTLLSTVVFFGPAIMRVRMEPDADTTALRALRQVATGLSIAALALLGSGWDAGPAVLFRLLAAAGLGVYAAATVAVCVPVLRASGRASPAAAHTWFVRGGCAWFMVATWGDAVAVATAQWWLLDAVGIGLLAGVLGQSVVAALNYLSPMVLVAGPEGRSTAARLLNFAPRARAATLNAGVACLVAAVLASQAGSGPAGPLAAAGWLTIAAVIAAQLAATGLLHARQRIGGVRLD